jgi:hypothetical protein
MVLGLKIQANRFGLRLVQQLIKLGYAHTTSLLESNEYDEASLHLIALSALI